MANDKINFYYDPIRQGYDTALWKTLSGVPAIIGSDLVFNTASAIGYADILKGNLTINMTIPAVPTAGDVRRFGFAQLALGAYVVFDITGNVFTAQTIDGKGNSASVVIPWRAAWTATPLTFDILWTGFSAEFRLNNERLAFINDTSVSSDPLSVYINNANADSTAFHYMEMETTQFYI